MLRYNITFNISRQVSLRDATDRPPRRSSPGSGRWRLLLSLFAATASHLAIFVAVVRFVHPAEAPSASSETAIAVVFTPAPHPDAPAEPSIAEPTDSAASPPPEPPATPEREALPEVRPVEPPPAPGPEPAPVLEPPPAPKPPLSRSPEPRTPQVETRPPKPVKRVKPASPSQPADVPPPARLPQPSAPAIAPAAPQGADTPVAADWQRSLGAWLAQHKNYPEIARRQGAQGGVVLRFTADRSGHVLDVELVRSAGSPILDHAAEAMLRDATVPPFNAGMAQDRITVTVQIRYSLTN